MDTLDTIAHWRTQIFSYLLSVVLVLGTITAIPSMALLATEGLWPVVVLDAVALAWLTAVWWFKRVPYKIRVLNFLAIIFVIGVGLMLTVGPVSQIYLFAAPLLAAILLGMWPALFALGGSALTIFVLSYAGFAKLHIAGMPDFAFLPSLLITMNFLFIGATITMSCSILLQRLARSLDDLHRFAASLQKGKNELHSLNGELRLTAAAVARLNDMVVIARLVNEPGAKQPIIFVNDAFERRTGYQRAEVIGRSWRMLMGTGTDPTKSRASPARSGAPRRSPPSCCTTPSRARRTGSNWNWCRSPTKAATTPIGSRSGVTSRSGKSRNGISTAWRFSTC